MKFTNTTIKYFIFFLLLIPFLSKGQVTLAPNGMFYLSSDLGPYFWDEVPTYTNKIMYVSPGKDVGPAAIFQTMGRRYQGSGSRYSDRNAWYSLTDWGNSSSNNFFAGDGTFKYVPNRASNGKTTPVYQFVTFSGRKPNNHTTTPYDALRYNTFTIKVEAPDFVGIDKLQEITVGSGNISISTFFTPAIAGVTFTFDNIPATSIDLSSLTNGSHTIKATKQYDNGTYVGQLKIQVSRQNIIGQATENLSRENNFILTRTFKKAGVNEVNIGNIRSVEDENQSVQYMDGIGRPVQTVSVMGSPAKNDLIQPFTYDAFGRENIKYQPYSTTSNNGGFRTNALSAQLDFYTNQNSLSSIKATQNPFSVSVFEPSPLNRIEQQGAPGDDWQPAASHTIKMEYSTNGTNEVRFWQVNNDGAVGTTFYDAGKLYKSIIKNENWISGHENTTEEFKDFEGKIVLKRGWKDNSTSLDTYYVYDDLGGLRYVLPPAVNENGQNMIDNFNESLPAFQHFIYGYHYDGLKRLVKKKIPGKGWEYMVYNKLDQLIMTQDANQEEKKQYLCIKYDAFGRVVITGLYTDTRTAAQLQTDLVNETVLYETRLPGSDYNNLSFPRSGLDILTVNYYDDYVFPDNIFGAASGDQASGERIKSLLTGTKVKNLGTSVMDMTVNYYDIEGRIVQTKATNHLGGTDQVDQEYNFPGELVSSTRTHIAKGITTTIEDVYTYDHMGRKISTKENINKQGQVVLNMLEYDEIGQLKTKNIYGKSATPQSLVQHVVLDAADIVEPGQTRIVTASKSITLSDGFIAKEGSVFKASIIDDSFLQSTLFTYNERGWLNKAESGKFKEELKYTATDLADIPNAPQANYNGNISAQRYNGNHSGAQYFKYGYDKLNRLVSSVHSNGILLNETIAYDVMGNIINLERAGNGNPIVYTYQNTNQSNVLDHVSGGLNGSYGYDLNGNVRTDGTKGGTATWTYNHLNLPISISGAVTANYTYDALGAKLKSFMGGINRDYVDGIHYEDGVLKFIATETGRAVRIGNTQSYSYEHNLSDHLGNVRVTIDDQGNNVARVVQENEYYAFGLVKPGGYLFGDKNNYLYNAKELQDGLGQYDYGARFYDPVIGRWNVIDPLSEADRSWSSYNYGRNNPVRFTDPDGMFWGDFLNDKGNKIGTDGIADKRLYHVSNKAEQQKIAETDREGGTTKLSDVRSARRVLSVESITGDPRENERSGKPGGASFNGTFNESFTRNKQASIINTALNSVDGYIDVALESNRGKLDFKSKFKAGELISLNGIYMNNHEALNYLWGASMSRINSSNKAEISVSDALLGAELYNVYDYTFKDSKTFSNQMNHREAIARGYFDYSLGFSSSNTYSRDSRVRKVIR
ncbi:MULTISPECIES: DUF6443 domain-containing protein [unclassified Pedobacter]|uniref:DUF6443 domain-containing protein n=1 Tax=unclassified Pedobacter TaxID=2628915 RepID=UPI001E058A69|nr:MULTISPECIES: DUF6443 domain-containing protein [unclassified Pedobacter]CAH0304242.1 tRNA(Glu)-specific nuclease WapA [Pedobacter sp. Bi36]CAH0313397.1 tRNA(Glu)-specific nuclease WapA [Pedobacter sp. Bi126]